jgi:hypothetical protein
MPTDLTELIERVERCSSPDRYLDGAIWKALHPQLADTNARDTAGWLVGGDHAQATRAPEITASLDAALALVEEKLPRWFWRAGHVPHVHWVNGVGYNHWCHLSRTLADHCDRDDEATGWAHTVPNAILLALLRALQSQSDREGRDG